MRLTWRIVEQSKLFLRLRAEAEELTLADLDELEQTQKVQVIGAEPRIVQADHHGTRRTDVICRNLTGAPIERLE